MNVTTTLNELETKMNAVINRFGIDSCMAHAETVYSQTFRSEAIKICDYLNNMKLSQVEYYTEFNQLVEDLWEPLKSEIYTRCTGMHLPSLKAEANLDDIYDGDCDCDYESDMHDHLMMSLIEEDRVWIDSRDAWIKSNNIYCEELITETTEIVFFCNYKGEGEGIAEVFSGANRKLPVFKSKSDSFNI